MKLGDLIPDPRNANKGTERGQGMLEASLRKYGAGRSILIDREGRIIAGNKTVENAGQLGMEDLLVVESDGTKLVAVQRTDLDLERDAAAKELAIADNRAGQVGLDWDAEVLGGLGGEVDLAQFWSPGELKDLLGEDGGCEAPQPEIDKAAELQEKWKTALGQVWEIPSLAVEGKAHRLMCGDCLSRDLAGLMLGTFASMAFTDPPLNVAIGRDSNPRHRQRAGLANDDMSEEDFGKFLARAAAALMDCVSGDIYCVLGASEWPQLDARLRGAGFHWSATIIWVKDLFVLGRSKYHRRYEPIWYGWREGGKSSFQGKRDLDDVWEIKRPRISDEHPTMKPTELPLRAIENSSAPGEAVLDVFLGAGSTMVAAELSGRLCYGMEIEPKYVAVALQRMSDMGLEPRLTEEGVDGRTETATHGAQGAAEQSGAPPVES